MSVFRRSVGDEIQKIIDTQNIYNRSILKIKRRIIIRLITGFMATTTNIFILSITSKNYSFPTRKRNLPFFLGWYDYINNSALPTQVSSKGIDLLMPYVENFNHADIQAFLNASNQAGVKVLLEIYRSLIEPENISGVKEFVNTYKHHPSVYGWYLYDEPEIQKPAISPDTLQRVYDAIKEEDKSKPVALVFADIKKIQPYMGAMDILMWDRYPCEQGVQEFKWMSSYQNAFNKVVYLANVNNKKFWNVLQGYSDNKYNKRLPTKAEFRYMFYLSVLEGADGLLVWAHFLSSDPWNKSVLYPAIRELKKYIPAIITGEELTNSVQVNHSEVKLKLFTIPKTKKYLMIVVNQKQARINFTIKLRPGLAGKAVAINEKTITYLSAQASFSAFLNPYEVRLYEIG